MRSPQVIRALPSILCACLFIGIADAQEIVAVPSNPSAVYTLGEEAVWHLRVRGDGVLRADSIRYVLKKNGLGLQRQGSLSSPALRASLAEPGTLIAEMHVTAQGRETAVVAGAAFSPGLIPPAEPRPEDFDAFWDEQLSRLRKTPDNPRVESAESHRPSTRYSKIRLDGIQGSHIYGQLAGPKRAGKHPALLILQWAGFYPLERQWVTEKAEAGWLAMNIMAHDLPMDRPPSFYEEARRTTHADVEGLGSDNREKSDFLRMLLSAYRAAEYLARHPDWDGRTLVVTGTSQGGMQAIAAAALHPRITACMVNAPAGCEMNGPLVDRAPGWPGWYWRTRGKDPELVRRTGRYFDMVNFAPRVRCPALVVLGLLDRTCPATGIFSMANRLRGPREVVVAPHAGHDGTNDVFRQHSESWLGALSRGDRLPVR